jgi:hypothetical protein
VDHQNLIAIDIHTHAEVSCWNPFDNYGEEYDRAADKYFGSNRRPTIDETVAAFGLKGTLAPADIWTERFQPGAADRRLPLIASDRRRRAAQSPPRRQTGSRGRSRRRRPEPRPHPETARRPSHRHAARPHRRPRTNCHSGHTSPACSGH